MIPNNYDNQFVVLDVETNGTSSLNHDLLSISIYKPDDKKCYDRFLPLELNSDVLTTDINGIKKGDLKDKAPLTQEEVDEVIKEFELDKRQIIIYGNLDEKFIRNYFKRKKLKGFDKFKFYNMKHDIISSSFEKGVATKDNLCNFFKIANVKKVHSGSNDCILEWQLFKKIYPEKLLISNFNVYIVNDEYFVPASYLKAYPNFKYYKTQLPAIDYDSAVENIIKIDKNTINDLFPQLRGLIVENLIDSMLEVEKHKSHEYERENLSKLKCIGRLSVNRFEIPIALNEDGTVSLPSPGLEKMQDDINSRLNVLKMVLSPVIKYIKNNIFKSNKIISQEIVKNQKYGVMARCDLSDENSILEIKTYYKEDLSDDILQLFFESNGRECHILQIDSIDEKHVIFVFRKIKFKNKINTASVEYRQNQLQQKIKNDDIEIIKYENTDSPVKLKCKKCGHEWETESYKIIRKPYCPMCNPEFFAVKTKTEKPKVSPEEAKEVRASRYKEKVSLLSNGNLEIIKYTGSKDKTQVKCNNCGNVWETRADRLLGKCYCPKCKKSKFISSKE